MSFELLNTEERLPPNHVRRARQPKTSKKSSLMPQVIGRSPAAQPKPMQAFLRH
jgi:hypothetical protein